MTTESINFRLSGAELDWLKSQQRDNESLNLTAKRLLLGLINNNVDSLVDTTVDTQNLEARIKEDIEARFEEMYHQMAFNLNSLLDKRFEEFSSQQSVPANNQVDTPVDISVDTPVVELEKSEPEFEAMTIQQLKDYLKVKNVYYKSRITKPELIKLCFKHLQ